MRRMIERGAGREALDSFILKGQAQFKPRNRNRFEQEGEEVTEGSITWMEKRLSYSVASGSTY